MKAEERLEKHRHVVTVLNQDWTWCKENQNHVVDSCEAYDIGREAIALLRRVLAEECELGAMLDGMLVSDIKKLLDGEGDG
jgi:hypothetical protein